MAITKADKVRLVEHYKKNEEGVKTVSILKQFAIPVNEINAVRRTLAKVDCKLSVVKKRIFLSQMKELGYGDVDLDTLEGSVVILYSYGDEFAGLKVIENVRKGWKKAKAKYEIDYVGGWFGKEWKDGEYVNSLAVLPSKEELVAKLLYLMTYPIQSFVMALDQIKQKQEGGDSSQS